MMKASTPSTKNNSKDDSGSRSSKSNSTNKTPTRKPSIKSCWVTPNVDEDKIVQVPTVFDKNDKDDMSTVSSSPNEQGYCSSSSEDLESVQQEVQNDVNESILNIKQLREQKRTKENKREENRKKKKAGLLPSFKVNTYPPYLNYNRSRTKPTLKSNKNMIAVMKRHILPEHPQETKIIKI